LVQIAQLCLAKYSTATSPPSPTTPAA